MLDWLMHSVAAQLGLAGTIIVICGLVAYFFPPFRRLAIYAAGLVFAAATIYAKGASDAKRAEKEKSQKAVDKVRKRYDEIDARTDDDRDVDDRLRNGKF